MGHHVITRLRQDLFPDSDSNYFVYHVCRTVKNLFVFNELDQYVLCLSTLAFRALSTQQPPYLASLLNLSNIPKQLSLRLGSGMNAPSL